VIVKGLITAVSGFLFIFAPGIPMGLIYQKYRTQAKSLLVTGMIVWIIAQVLAIFVQAMVRPVLPEHLNIIDPGNTLEYAVSILGPFIAALFLSTGLFIVLRREKKRASVVMFSVLTLGFGAGLINQVFNGLNLVGSGVRLALGAATGTDLGELAEVEFLDLILVLMALIVFRIALLIVTALVGVMVGRAVSGEKKFFWQAVILSALFTWIVIVIFFRMGDSPGQLIVGQANPITSIIAILFCAFASILSYHLLTKQFEQLRS
jgi:hypothetical protein